jgi:hypothetical protein
MPRLNPNAKDGTLFANAFYTSEDLKAKGYGDKFQMEARADGVPCLRVGRRDGYMGAALLEHIARRVKTKKQ